MDTSSHKVGIKLTDVQCDCANDTQLLWYSLILAFWVLELTCVPICAGSNTFMVTRARPGTVKRADAGTDVDHVSYMFSVVEHRI